MTQTGTRAAAGSFRLRLFRALLEDAQTAIDGGDDSQIHQTVNAFCHFNGASIGQLPTSTQRAIDRLAWKNQDRYQTRDEAPDEWTAVAESSTRAKVRILRGVARELRQLIASDEHSATLRVEASP